MSESEVFRVSVPSVEHLSENPFGQPAWLRAGAVIMYAERVRTTGPLPWQVRSTFVDTTRGWKIEVEPTDPANQVWEIKSLVVTATDPSHPVTTEALREIADQLPALMSYTAHEAAFGLRDEMSMSDAVAAAGQRGDELARVAETYKRAVEQMLPPVVMVEKELGLTKATANRRIRKARDLGLLPPTGRESK